MSDNEARHGMSVSTARLQRRVRVAQGLEPGDLLIAGGRVVNVFTGAIESGNVVIADGWIAGVGLHDWEAAETCQLAGELVIPGLIDAHMHLESSLLLPSELASLVVPRGTSTIIADPHEIGNVLGIPGIEQLAELSEGLAIDMFFMAPSCVPATPTEDAGATIDADGVRQLLKHPRVLGLAEMMDFPGVWGGRPDVMEKLLAAHGARLPADGHAPGITGLGLQAYIAAGVRADHESTTAEEAEQKAAAGMLVQVRDGSSARNLETLLPSLVAGKLGDWCCATDDIHPDDILERGHIDNHLRRVVKAGVPLPEAIRHATLVPARHYGLRDRGAVAPGYRAHLAIVSDESKVSVRTVFFNGKMVADDGRYLPDSSHRTVEPQNTIRLGSVSLEDFDLPLASNNCRVIEASGDQIVTRSVEREAKCDAERWVFSSDRDLCLAACLERHQASGKVGLGLVTGFGLTEGAIGSSVGHDSHNLTVLGTNPTDMLACVQALEKSGGGYVAANGGKVTALMPLPLAGLISTSPVDVVCRELEEIHAAAGQLGCCLPSPFLTLAFLPLPVIPELRVTPRGLFDVVAQEFVTTSTR